MMDGMGLMVHRGHSLAESDPSRWRAMCLNSGHRNIVASGCQEKCWGFFFSLPGELQMFFLSEGVMAWQKKNHIECFYSSSHPSMVGGGELSVSPPPPMVWQLLFPSPYLLAEQDLSEPGQANEFAPWPPESQVVLNSICENWSPCFLIKVCFTTSCRYG